jgi:SAM-dependent methyltransferase
VTQPDRRELGRLFNEAPELYDRVRPTYPDRLFADLAAITGLGRQSSVLEVGCGTGQATRSLAALGYSVTAIDPGAGMAALARQRLAAFRNVGIENSAFEEWDDGGRRFDLVVAASAWHWVDPSVGWRRAHDVLHPGQLVQPGDRAVVPGGAVVRWGRLRGSPPLDVAVPQARQRRP